MLTEDLRRLLIGQCFFRGPVQGLWSVLSNTDPSPSSTLVTHFSTLALLRPYMCARQGLAAHTGTTYQIPRTTQSNFFSVLNMPIRNKPVRIGQALLDLSPLLSSYGYRAEKKFKTGQRVAVRADGPLKPLSKFLDVQILKLERLIDRQPFTCSQVPFLDAS